MTVASNEDKKLRVAIVGGGLVGSFAAIAISSLANVEVTVYEKSAGPREAGAWISLTESSLEVLTKFIDVDEINGITATPGQAHKYKLKDFKTNITLTTQESITQKDFRYTNSKTQRVALLNLLLKHVPEGIIQYDSEIDSIEFNDDNDTVVLNLKDGPKEFDLLIAADGIYSKVRNSVYPGTNLSFRGSVAYRNTFSEEQAKLVENYTLPDDTLSYLGEGKVVFLSRLGLGSYGMVLSVPEPKEVIERLRWDKKLSQEDFERVKGHFKGWPKIITDLIDASGYLNAFPLESAPWLEHLTYKDKVAFIGDAAHPTSGAYGAGAGFGFSDVWALYRSLEVTGSNTWKRRKAQLNKDLNLSEDEVPKDDVYNLKKSLFLFDETRRYFLKDVYEQMTRDNLNKEFVKSAKDPEDQIERRIEVSATTAWIREHNVEIEFQRVRSKNFEVLIKDRI